MSQTGVTLEFGVDCGTIAVRYARFWCRCRLWWGFWGVSFVFRRLSSQLKTQTRFWTNPSPELVYKTHRRAAPRHQKRGSPVTETDATCSAGRSGVLGFYPWLFTTRNGFLELKRADPPLIKQPKTPLRPPECSTASVLGLSTRPEPVPARSGTYLSSTEHQSGLEQTFRSAKSIFLSSDDKSSKTTVNRRRHRLLASTVGCYPVRAF